MEKDNLICLNCCLEKTSDEVRDIFDDLGIELNLCTLLEEHFQLNVVREENKKKTICLECLDTLTQCIDAEAYAMQQLENDEDLEELTTDMRYLEENNNSNTSTREDQTFHIKLRESNTDGDIYVILNDTDGDGTEEVVEEEEEEEEEQYELTTSVNVTDLEGITSSETQSTDNDLQYLNKYLDNCIHNDLEAININIDLECKPCKRSFDKFRELFKHMATKHKTNIRDKEHFSCTIDDCKTLANETKTLARHILLRHCEVQNLQIIGECVHCQFRFTNFIDFNKHTCYQQNLTHRKRGICPYCKIKFVSSKRCKFHIQFHLPKRRQKLCFICEKTFEDDVELFTHVNYKHRSIPDYTCTVCDVRYKRQSAFLQHLEGCTERHLSSDNCNKTSMDVRDISDYKFQCNDCWMTFFSPVKCGIHRKKHQVDRHLNVYVCTVCGVVGVNTRYVQSASVGNCKHEDIRKDCLPLVLTCRNCALDFKTTKQYIAHLQYATHNEQTFKCPECEESFNDETSIRVHVMQEHTNYEKRLEIFPIKRLFTCRIVECKMTFDQWAELQRHNYVNHKIRTCKHCELEITADEFAAHKKSCKNAKPYKCQYCGQEYKSKMSCAVHIGRSHNAKQNNVCSYCKAIFKTQESMQAHIDYMHIPKECTECHKVIKNQRNYDVHVLAVHEKVQRHFCSHCNKGFYYKSECVAHEKNLHSGALYKCSKCDFTTHYADSLELHMGVHFKSKSLKCPHCSKTFVRKNSLELHLKTHTAEKRFVCSERLANGCEKSFLSNYQLVSHIKKYHTEKAPKTKKKNSSKIGKRKLNQTSVETTSEDEKPTIENELRRVSLRKRNKTNESVKEHTATM